MHKLVFNLGTAIRRNQMILKLILPLFYKLLFFPSFSLLPLLLEIKILISRRVFSRLRKL